LLFNFLFASFKLLTNFEKAYPPQNSRFCDWSMFSSACCRQNAQELTYHRRLPIDFKESQVASCKHLQCQNHRFKVFGMGYWNNFKN
jgi:hypothetical protein